MTIMAVDPGSTSSGLAVLNAKTRRLGRAGVFSNHEILKHIEDSTCIDVLALEQMSSYGKPVGQEVFATVFWAGRFAERWIATGRQEESIRQAIRQHIKRHLWGFANAKDSDVLAAVRQRMQSKNSRIKGDPLEGVHSHAIAALALAFYVAETEGLQ